MLPRASVVVAGLSSKQERRWQGEERSGKRGAWSRHVKVWDGSGFFWVSVSGTKLEVSFCLRFSTKLFAFLLAFRHEVAFCFVFGTKLFAFLITFRDDFVV
jgi:hypothetical protein